ncbi:MAG: M23 family metallopeptidase [Sporomusaceae bacterium]|nr:M23 family metallopeptidase [Sporomusaceae bacterium]
MNEMKQKAKPDKREYTLMLVPHHGKDVRSIRIPIRYFKYAVSSVLVVTLLFFGTLFHLQYKSARAVFDKSEYVRLQQVNHEQEQEIINLAQQAAKLQENMNRLNALDADIRRMLNSEEAAQTSRSMEAPRPTGAFNGQGGPGPIPQITDIASNLNSLDQAINAREQSLLEIKQRIADKNAKLAKTPSIWPAEGDVTSRFGYRSSPFGGGADFHPGIDIANNYGTPVHAVADGVVIYADWYSGYGKLVQIDHGNGIVSFYGHNQALLVKVGQTIKKGDVISEMGSTGLSTGPHVHYEIRVNGTAVDPTSFL